MSEPVPQMRWWGWGEQQHAGGLPEHALGFLRENIGTAENPRPPVALEEVTLEPSRLSETVRGELVGICGAEHVGDGHAERVLHAAGKGYPDLVRLRAGEPEGAPDVIVHPAGHEEIMAVLSPLRRSLGRRRAIRRRDQRRRRRRTAAREPRGGARARPGPPRRRC